MRPESRVSDVTPDRQLGHSRSQELAAEKIHAANLSPRLSTQRSIAIVATCTAAMVVNIANTTSVSIALPLIGKAVNIEQDQLQWLLSAYALSSGCPLLLFGRLADLYGRKKAFLLGMLFHGIFALGLGFSRDGLTLDILRGFQGMGMAAAIPAAMGILAHAFPPSRARSIAFATFAAGAPIGGAFGNVIGGVLTQLSKVHWRAPFFLSAAMSALCIFGALVSFDRDTTSSEVDTRVDWIGAFLVTTGLVLLVFILGQGPIAGWRSPYIIACLIIGVIFVILFIFWEHHLEKSVTGPEKPKSIWTPPPLMKLSIWGRAKGRMAVVLVIAFLNWCGFTAWTFWVQLYYQNYLGLSPVLSMVRLLPMFVTGILCNFFVALVVSRLPLVGFMVSGTLLTGFACVLFALINPSTTFWAFGFPSTVMVVFGADFVFAAGTLFVAKVVYPHEQSLAGGLFQTMCQIGTAFGLTISTIVFNRVVAAQSAKLGVVVNSDGSNAPLPAELLGYRAAQWTSAAFPFLASVMGAIFLWKVGVVGEDKEIDPSELTITEQEGGIQP